MSTKGNKCIDGVSATNGADADGIGKVSASVLSSFAANGNHANTETMFAMASQKKRKSSAGERHNGNDSTASHVQTPRTPSSFQANPLAFAGVDAISRSRTPSTTGLSFRTKLCYSFGHVYNDMTVAIWFSYTLLFFHHRLPGGYCGALMLLGQVSDAIASPFIGLASDRFAARFPALARFGRRKLFHFIGVALSTVTIPLVYNRCLLGENQPPAVQFAYYATLVFVYQTAWAATQVTHVALVNDLTADQAERITLNAYRQAATMASNIAIFMITFFLLQNIDGGAGGGGDGDGSGGGSNQTHSNGTLFNSTESVSFREEDLIVFTYLAYIVCAIGIIFSLLFHIFVREPDEPPPPLMLTALDIARLSAAQPRRSTRALSRSDSNGSARRASGCRTPSVGGGPIFAIGGGPTTRFTSFCSIDHFRRQDSDTSAIEEAQHKAANLVIARSLRDEFIAMNRMGARLSFSGSIDSTPDVDLARAGLRCSKDPVSGERPSRKTKWYHWFRSFAFWKLTLIYTMARMLINVSQVYMPMYLQNFLHLPKNTLAIIPLTSFIASFVFSFVTNEFSKRTNTRWSLVVSAMIGIACAAWIWLGGDNQSFRSIQVYGVAAIIGFAGTGLLISSLSLNSDLVGSNLASNAFVFAAMSFFDKSINGIVIETLEQLKPAKDGSEHGVGGGDGDSVGWAGIRGDAYYQYVMFALTAFPSIITLALVFTIIRTRYGKRISSDDITVPTIAH